MDLLKILLLVVMAAMMGAVATSLAIPILIRKHTGQNIREEGPASHQGKSGTPSMGGLAILVTILITAVATKQFSSDIILPAAGLLLFGLIGFADDYLKIKKRHNLGLRAWQKISLQIIFALIMTLYGLQRIDGVREVLIPFSGKLVDFGIFYLPFGIFLIVAMVNSVNLTDGLDGLASGTSFIVAAFFALAASLSGFENISAMAAIIGGACIGFLFFNRYPAKVFMGDTGSMALGGGLAGLAMAIKMELFIPIVALVFVLEALSVIIQVASYKLSGKRIFKMAPLHHHFELKGMKETKVVAMFWFASILCFVIGMGAL